MPINPHYQFDPRLLDFAWKKQLGGMQDPLLNWAYNANTAPEAEGNGQQNPVTALDQYRRIIQTMPTMDQYRPSTARRIAAALATGANEFRAPGTGNAAGTQILESPYTEAMKQFQTKVAPIGQLAQLENVQAKQRTDEMTARARETAANAQMVNATRPRTTPAHIAQSGGKAVLIDNDGKVVWEGNPDPNKLTPDEKFEHDKALRQMTNESHIQGIRIHETEANKRAEKKGKSGYKPFAPRAQNQMEQERARWSSIRDILNEYPEYKDWFDEVKDTKGNVVGYEFKLKPGLFSMNQDWLPTKKMLMQEVEKRQNEKLKRSFNPNEILNQNEDEEDNDPLNLFGEEEEQ